MSQRSAEEIRSAVQAAYGARALEVLSSGDAACCGSSCCSDGAAGVKDQFYAVSETAELPESVVSYGCGNPTAIAGLRPGETVLDLGSGAGMDCFLSARQIGPEGRVIGLDMTDAMIELAEANRAKLGVENVEFRKGLIESIPLPDASVDVIISNCVINLSPDKPAVLAESLRVLRPGGRLHVSDVVLLRNLSSAEQGDLALWAGCISGALSIGEYDAGLKAAGFEDISIVIEGARDGTAAGDPWRSALINARRPVQGTVGKPWFDPTVERIDFVPSPEASSAPCCGPGAPAGSRCC